MRANEEASKVSIHNDSKATTYTAEREKTGQAEDI